MKVRLLLVEDERQEQVNWSQKISVHNAKVDGTEDPSYELITANTYKEAISFIESRDFDAAIVDLRLTAAAGTVMDNSGNRIVTTLLEAEMAAIAIFTGEPTAVEIPDYAKDLVHVFTKGEGSDAVWQWLVGQSQMIIAMRKAQALIKGEMAKFFSKSIWPRWANWLSDETANDKEFLATAVARHLASHVHAALLDKYNQKAHPEEWFFVPPIHSGVRTGDIIRTDKHGLEIVITPRCDLATGKRKTIQLAICNDISTEWNQLRSSRATVQAQVDELRGKGQEVPDNLKKQLESTTNKIGAIIKHRSTSSLHFLPRMKLSDGSEVGPLMVNFDRIRSEAVGEIEKDVIASRIASVSSEFVPSFVERLGAFFSRIGTPDYSNVE